MALKNLGVGHVIAKAATALHGAILERVGADRVVYPEREMGQRAAHSLAIPGVIDYLDVAPRVGIVKVSHPPRSWAGPSRISTSRGASRAARSCCAVARSPRAHRRLRGDRGRRS
jgi:trk system potassium uptake protein TrkA